MCGGPHDRVGCELPSAQQHDCKLGGAVVRSVAPQSAGEAVLRGADGLGEQAADVPATGVLDDPPAVPPGGDELGQAQLRQVLRHRGAGDPDRSGEGRHVVLPAAEPPQHGEPGRVGEHAERLGRGVHRGADGYRCHRSEWHRRA